MLGYNNYRNSARGPDGHLHGRGVQGYGPEAGVGGFSISGVGVIGQSTGDGIRGFRNQAPETAS